LDDIERLALRHALGDIEHHRVAQILQAREQRERAADLAGADECDFRSGHGIRLEGNACETPTKARERALD
jgi:uncharacterized membrane protein